MTDPTAGLPRLVTCSYSGYQRRMGTAVRITISAPRWIKLPDPRYTKYKRWPYIKELAPKEDYFKAPAHVFQARYLAQLEELSADIERKLPWIEPENGALALLCFEKDVTDPLACHRRMFAAWWEKRTGQHVPELGGTGTTGALW